MAEKNKIFFISDVHLGLYPAAKSLEREKILVRWLDSIKTEAAELYLLGDIFDFWHEYHKVVPRGFTRFLGKLAEMSDSGTKIHYFTGNHDVWVYDYLPAEIGLTLYRNHIVREIEGFRFFIGHGDGLGHGDYGYKLLKAIFTNRILQWLFARIHPNASLAFGHRWSRSSRYAKGIDAEPYKGEKKELQMVFARKTICHDPFDFFIFGHRHIPYDIRIGEKTRVINLGDWITHFTYAVWQNKTLELHSILPEKEKGILQK
ncbi:MAG: UDP-2,3-diacylglucosamine diphosphatase [Bacteroidales bacterium]|nr:UDP-2,3-diacylglucosamine diphosphatase [Bacteroidales bacterium]